MHAAPADPFSPESCAHWKGCCWGTHGLCPWEPTWKAQLSLPAGEQEQSSSLLVHCKEMGPLFTYSNEGEVHSDPACVQDLAKAPSSEEQLILVRSIKKLDMLEGSLTPEKDQNPSRSCFPSTVIS